MFTDIWTVVRCFLFWFRGLRCFRSIKCRRRNNWSWMFYFLSVFRTFGIIPMSTGSWTLGRCFLVCFCGWHSFGSNICRQEDTWLSKSHFILTLITFRIRHLRTDSRTAGRFFVGRFRAFCSVCVDLGQAVMIGYVSPVSSYGLVSSQYVVCSLTFRLLDSATFVPFVFYIFPMRTFSHCDYLWSCRSHSSFSCSVFEICYVSTNIYILWKCLLYLYFPCYWTGTWVLIEAVLLDHHETSVNVELFNIFIFNCLVLDQYIMLSYASILPTVLLFLLGFFVYRRLVTNTEKASGIWSLWSSILVSTKLCGFCLLFITLFILTSWQHCFTRLTSVWIRFRLIEWYFHVLFMMVSFSF